MGRCLFLLTVSLCTSGATACNVPVFRYALERWKADPADVIIFHNQVFTFAEQSKLDQLNSVAHEPSGTANIRVTSQDVNAEMDDSVGLLWDELRKQEVELPYLVVQSRVAGRVINCSRGELSDLSPAVLMNSPARAEMTRRLLNGDSAVWLVLKSNDDQRHTAFVSSLQEQLARLSEEIALPDGIGLPGSELFADIPLLMKFSVLEVDPQDPQESFLAELVKGFEPDCLSNGRSLVIPVFGRARALEVIPSDQLNEGLITDLTMFLCGACSCQVKERNPGFDLLTNTAWDNQLFGETGTALPPLQIPTTSSSNSAVVLHIPPGRTDRLEASAAAASDADQRAQTAGSSSNDISQHASNLSLLVSLLVVVIIALIAGRRINI